MGRAEPLGEPSHSRPRQGPAMNTGACALRAVDI